MIRWSGRPGRGQLGSQNGRDDFLDRALVSFWSDRATHLLTPS